MKIIELIEKLQELSSELGDDKSVYVQSYDSKGVLSHFDIVGAISGNESNEIELEIENFE
ncbi:hypothetical protein V6B05_01455 [Lactococcus garvieae]|uniref:hypothetical protein n=1 Tax=Lactococcus garvieae TaxID=1363 RepID=UPI001F623A1B|nr:hypothetical protein [Lactococcus garvieae]MCI3860093.1 hypothetical protein [Lactococcus garvieae]